MSERMAQEATESPVVERRGFPETFSELKEISSEELKVMRDDLKKNVDELSFNDEGAVKNENRFVVDALAQRVAILDEMISRSKSELRAEELFELLTLRKR